MSKTKEQLEVMLGKAKDNMNKAATNRMEHTEAGYTVDCDYYNHWTRVWEYYRGQANALLEVLKED